MTAWSISEVQVVAAFSGDKLFVLPLGENTTIDDVYESVNKHLDGSVKFTLMHDDIDIYELQHDKSRITSPVKLVKHHRRGVHDVLRAMNHMDGSSNVERFLCLLNDDPDKFVMESATALYRRIFDASSYNLDGYMTRSRVLTMHSMFSQGAAKADILNALQATDRTAALTHLICCHNSKTIEVERRRFAPLAHSLGLKLR